MHPVLILLIGVAVVIGGDALEVYTPQLALSEVAALLATILLAVLLPLA